MRATSITVQNWRNFWKPGEVSLGWRTFIVGANASGKSNFLDAFRFFRDLAVAGGGLQQAVHSRRGLSAIRCLSTRSDPVVRLEIGMEEDAGGRISTWKYSLHIKPDRAKRPVITHESVEHDGEVLLTRPNDDDRADPERLTQTAMEQVSWNREFRDIKEFFEGISYRNLLPPLIRDPGRFSSERVTDDPYGRDFLDRVVLTPSKIKDARLRNLLKALNKAVPQLEELAAERDAKGVPHLKAKFRHWRATAANQQESEFSDGTLRLFGLLWSLFEGSGMLLLEEPELSLHTAIVRQIPTLMSNVERVRKTRRQVLVSTHSFELLDNRNIGADEVIWLEPSPEGTAIKQGSRSPEVIRAIEGGLTPADVVLPRTRPEGADELALFRDLVARV